MKISRNNYEEYFLDYIEGSLDDSQIRELRIFLADNPDLEKELKEYKLISLIPDKLAFTEKELLKKNRDESLNEINETNFSYYSIAKIENDLGPAEEEYFDSFISDNHEKKKELELFKQCKLEPDSKQIFINKDILKKDVKSIKPIKRLIPYFSAAASIIIIFGIYISVNNFNEKQTETTITEIEGKRIIDKSINDVVNEEKTSEFISEEPKTPDNRNDIIVVAPKNKESNFITSNEIYVPDNDTDILLRSEATDIEQQEIKINSINSRKPHPVSIFSPRQRILAKAEIQEQIPIQKSGDEYVNVFQFAGREIKKRVLKKDADEKLSIWDIADAGIRGVNTITGKDIKLKKFYNEEGKISSIGINTELYQLAARLRK